jgi:hypothetical protein
MGGCVESFPFPLFPFPFPPSPFHSPLPTPYSPLSNLWDDTPLLNTGAIVLAAIDEVLQVASDLLEAAEAL